MKEHATPTARHSRGLELQTLGFERMGGLARSQIAEAREAFGARNVERAQHLVRQDEEINRLNREIFRHAIEIGDHIVLREWAMFRQRPTAVGARERRISACGRVA